MFHKLLVGAIKLHHSGKGDLRKKEIGEICLPKPKTHDLKFESIEYAVKGYKVLGDDEDWETSISKAFLGMTPKKVLFAILGREPFNDDAFYFETDEEVKELINKHFSKVMPDANETFEDMESDEGMSKIAFYGIGQVLLKRSRDQGYEVDTTALSTLAVRPSYERYGAKATFGENQKLLSIFVSSLNKTFYSQDGHDWEHAKWVWRCSLFTYVTMGPHLVQAHLTISNFANIAARTSLGENHPIRRVLKVFLYNAGK